MARRYKKKDPYAKREAALYENPVPSREFIMQYLDELGYPTDKKHLLKAFALKNPKEIEAIQRRLTAMQRDGQLIKDRSGKYALVKDLELVCGQVSIYRDGHGLLIPDEGKDPIYLAYRQTRLLFHGDRALVQLTGNNHRSGRPEGIVVKVVERTIKQLIGRFHSQSGTTWVTPDGKQSHQDIMIPPEKTNGATPEQFVQIAIIDYPNKRLPATGEVVEVIGDMNHPHLAIQLSVYSHQLPHTWNEAVLDAIKHFPHSVGNEDKHSRIDLRDKPFVTIDGADAKDFDDAVYCKPLPKGGWTLWVAIADVSHYVKPETALDKDAFERGNSVYFPNQSIPMLPDILCHQLCSLKPKVDRLSLVCEMHISAKGKLTHHTFYRGVIHSKARLTYKKVADILNLAEKGQSTSINKRYTTILPHLLDLQKLHKQLSKARASRGALAFKTTETKILFNSAGKIKSIQPHSYNEAHSIIEECMLLANVSAAQFLNQHNMPTLYRIHEGVSEAKFTDLCCFLNEIGLKLHYKGQPKPLDYVNVMEQAKGRPDETLIQMVLLRLMKQALYTPDIKPHFGLAFDAYCHFTSPIRRYPDLIAHRGIGHILDGGTPEDFLYTKSMLEQFGRHCSTTERRADEAVRDTESWLKCEYIKDKLGKQFDGIITHVTNFGIFVMLDKIYVEGLVHISELCGDYYHYDNVHHRLVGKHTGKIYRLGDKLKVLVARVNIDDRQIDFALANTNTA